MSGVNTETKETQFMVYPNPAKDVISFTIPAGTNNCFIEIFNVIGVKLLSQKIYAENNSVDINSLPLGVYFYQIKSSNEVLRNGKFVKE